MVNASLIGARTEPPTDAEVADPQIAGWLFQPREARAVGKGDGSAYEQFIGINDLTGLALAAPRLLQVLFVGEGEPRAFAPGCAGWLYFRPFRNEAGEDVVPDDLLVGWWRPLRSAGAFDAEELRLNASFVEARTEPSTDAEAAGGA